VFQLDESRISISKYTSFLQYLRSSLADMEEPSPPEPLNRPLRLLSLDGGGIRGISELVILQEIMHRVGRALKVETPLPADYFDMICGTSTGG
jgi:hypothetical protein